MYLVPPLHFKSSSSEIDAELQQSMSSIEANWPKFILYCLIEKYIVVVVSFMYQIVDYLKTEQPPAPIS